MTKKFSMILLLMMGGLLAEKTPTRLVIATEEMDKTETSMDDLMREQTSQLFQQEAAPILLNANFARLFFRAKLDFDLSPKPKDAFESINLSHWHLYIVNWNRPELNQFVLSVPVTYAEKLKGSLGESLGFNQTALKQYNADVEGIRTLIKDLGYDQPVETAAYADAIKNLFDTTANTCWTIFMSGHGRECLLAPEKTPIVNLLKSTSTRPIGRIADISTAEFLKFITFLAKDLDVRLLLLATCYSPGYHAQAISQALAVVHNKTMAIALCGSSSDEMILHSWRLSIFDKSGKVKEGSDRSYESFFAASDRLGAGTPEAIADSIGYVCSQVAVSIKTANASEFVPFEFKLDSDKKAVETPSKGDILVAGTFNVTRNEVTNRVFIDDEGGLLEFKVADTSHFLFSKIILAKQNSLDYAIDKLVGRNNFGIEPVREFRRIRNPGSAHTMTIRVESLIGKKKQTQLEDVLKIESDSLGKFVMESVIAIRYPSQLLYDGELIFTTQSPDNKLTIHQLMIGDKLLPNCIEKSEPQKFSPVELRHKINDMYIQSMVNEYFQELAAFGTIGTIKLFLKVIKAPANLKKSRKVLALLEKRNLLPYTLPNQRGIQLAFATAMAQGELETARELFAAITPGSKCLEPLLNGLIAIYDSIPRNVFKKPEVYKVGLAFLHEELSKITTK